MDRDSLWKIMRHYGVPNKYVSVIKEIYRGMTCRILHGGDMSESFNVQTGVRQGCLLSPFVFLLAIDWVMRETTEEERNGIQWTLFDHLDDLDFADDLVLLSHNHKQMQGKTTALQTTASKIGLKLNTEKTKMMRINTSRTEPIRLGNNEIEDVTSFTYVGSIVDTTGGTDQDIKIRIGKARTAYIILRKIWNSRELSRPTKIRTFNSNVKAVLFMVQRHGAQMSHQTNECSPSSRNAYAEFLGSGGQITSTTTSSGSKQTNCLHPYRSAKGNEIGSDIDYGRIRAASHDRPKYFSGFSHRAKC